MLDDSDTKLVQSLVAEGVLLFLGRVKAFIYA